MVERELLKGFGIHEVVKLAVVVKILHLLSLYMSAGILVRGAEGALEYGAGHNVFKPRTDESCAFAGLYMLEISNGPYLSIDLHRNTLPEIASHQHKKLPPNNKVFLVYVLYRPAQDR